MIRDEADRRLRQAYLIVHELPHSEITEADLRVIGALVEHPAIAGRLAAVLDKKVSTCGDVKPC